ncbi:unnamed protein product, partial [Acidithrix sp. C25]
VSGQVKRHSAGLCNGHGFYPYPLEIARKNQRFFPTEKKPNQMSNFS